LGNSEKDIDKSQSSVRVNNNNNPEESMTCEEKACLHSLVDSSLK